MVEERRAARRAGSEEEDRWGPDGPDPALLGPWLPPGAAWSRDAAAATAEELRGGATRDRSGPRLLDVEVPRTGGPSAADPLVLRFDEPVRAGPGAIRIVGQEGTIRIAARDGDRVTIEGEVVRIGLDRSLDPDTTYTLELGRKAFRDLAGNPVQPARCELFPAVEPAPDAGPAPPRASWTLMVYMAADNDLERWALDDLAEMERVALPTGVNLVTLVDRSPWYVAGPDDFTDTRIGPVRPDGDPRRVGGELASIGERDTGDPATLTEFLDWAHATFPAERYGLVVWNHGGGLDGVAWDDTSRGDRLTLPELRTAIERAAIDRLDFLGFDACSMAMVEVASELRDLARVMVASQELEPADGWPYDRWLEAFVENPRIAPASLGRVLVDRYVEAYAGKSGITLSALDLEALPRLEETLAGFVDAVERSADPDELAAIARAAMGARAFPHDAWATDRDLEGFLRAVEKRVEDPAIDAAARTARAALDEVVLAAGGTVPRAYGLSVHLPGSDGGIGYDDEPSRLAFLERVAWDGLLDRLETVV
jgi:hypothetical protein